MRKDKLNEENKLRSPRNLLKGMSNVTFWRPFVTFKYKAVKNQMGKVKPTFPQYDAIFVSIFTNK